MLNLSFLRRVFFLPKLVLQNPVIECNIVGVSVMKDIQGRIVNLRIYHVILLLVRTEDYVLRRETLTIVVAALQV